VLNGASAKACARTQNNNAIKKIFITDQLESINSS
jgi:hypothetical protein